MPDDLFFVFTFSFTTGVIIMTIINWIPLECLLSNPQVDRELLSPFGQAIVANFEAVKDFCLTFFCREPDSNRGTPKRRSEMVTVRLRRSPKHTNLFLCFDYQVMFLALSWFKKLLFVSLLAVFLRVLQFTEGKKWFSRFYGSDTSIGQSWVSLGKSGANPIKVRHT